MNGNILWESRAREFGSELRLGRFVIHTKTNPRADIGRLRRVKYGPHVRSKQTVLDKRWGPIEVRSANFRVNRRIKCNRHEFSSTAACALTIHKSPEGTFNRVVCDHHKSHRQLSVYVAFSTGTSLEFLYLTNASDDLTIPPNAWINSPNDSTSTGCIYVEVRKFIG